MNPNSLQHFLKLQCLPSFDLLALIAVLFLLVLLLHPFQPPSELRLHFLMRSRSRILPVRPISVKVCSQVKPLPQRIRVEAHLICAAEVNRKILILHQMLLLVRWDTTYEIQESSEVEVGNNAVDGAQSVHEWEHFISHLLAREE